MKAAADSRRFVLIGHPVAHSLSPVIHRAAYQELGLSHSYEVVDCADEAAVVKVIDALRSGELAGANVTIPWKRLALRLADLVAPSVQRVGVANVLARGADGAIVAHNTDVPALTEEFQRLSGSVRRVLVIGNGGSAPAVIVAAQDAGADRVALTARKFVSSVPEAEWPHASELVALGVSALAWPESDARAKSRLREAVARIDLIVNCTSAGMAGADDGQKLAEIVPWEHIPQSALAYDLIYNPASTPFLERAKSAGWLEKMVLGMLVAQAALAIELWLSVSPSRSVLLAAAKAELAARGQRVKSREGKRGSLEGPWPFVETHSDLLPAEREWLHTNGAGAYSMSTIAMMHTRRHHGAFIAALAPPLGRHVILSHAETNVTVDDERRRVYRLATHQFPNVAPTPGYRLLHSFAQDPLPRWVFRLGAHTLERTMCLARGRNALIIGYTWRGRVPARISTRPLMPLRPVAGLMVEHGAMNQVVMLRGGSVEVQPISELPPIAFKHEGVFMGSPDWWRRFEYLEDRRLGNAFQEDMWTPGVFEVTLEPNRTAYLLTAVGALPPESPADLQAEVREALLAQDPGPSRPARVRQMFVAAEQFCADAVHRPVILAGYPWHAVYTRDLLLSVVGLHLVRGRMDLARRALSTALSALHAGLLPETLLAVGKKRPKPLPDATLWLFEVARELRLRLPAADPLLKDQLYQRWCAHFARALASQALRLVDE